MVRLLSGDLNKKYEIVAAQGRQRIGNDVKISRLEIVVMLLVR